MKKIEKYKLLAVMVRGFFDAFASGIIDCQDVKGKEKFRPKMLKNVVLEHCDHIPEAFANTIFYPLAAMNCEYDDVIRMVQEAQENGSSMAELVHQVCEDEEMYDAMKREYIRNYGSLFVGKLMNPSDFYESYPRPEGKPTYVPVDKAISLTVRNIMTAYALGLQCSGKEGVVARQKSIFGSVISAVQVLLNDKATALDDFKSANDLAQVLVKVTQTPENFNALVTAMDEGFDLICEMSGAGTDDELAN